MRDPARIERLLLKLTEVWVRNSDWRLGQLVCNLSRDGAGYDTDPFYLEDSDLERELDLLLLRNREEAA